MTAIDVIGYAGYVIGAVVILFSKTKSDNIKDLIERVSILEKEREYARNQNLENQKAIANLEGQLNTYKDIPLGSIADSLKSLPTIMASNQKILERLEKVDNITVNQQVKEQSVEHPVINEKL